MKRSSAVLVSLLILPLIFSGCRGSKAAVKSSRGAQSAYNPFDAPTSEEQEDISFDSGIVNDETQFTYNGAPVEYESYYNNSGKTNLEFGYMVFINGIPQNISVDGSTPQTMYKLKINGKTKRNFKVSFTPNTGNAGDKLGIYMLSVIDPSYMPPNTMESFGNKHQIAQMEPVILNYLKSSKEDKLDINTNFTNVIADDSIKKEYLVLDRNNSGQYKKRGHNAFFLKYNGNYMTTKIKVKEGDKLNFTLEGLCDPEDAKYRTTVYIDNVPVKMADGNTYMDMQLKKNMLSRQSFQIDTTGRKGTHSITTMSVPIGDDSTKIFNTVEQPDAKILVVGD